MLLESSLIPKYHRELLHGDYFSLHNDNLGNYWIICNKFPTSVYTGPIDCLSESFDFFIHVNQFGRVIFDKGVVYFEK